MAEMRSVAPVYEPEQHSGTGGRRDGSLPSDAAIAGRVEQVFDHAPAAGWNRVTVAPILLP
jgi:hypothetical protein